MDDMAWESGGQAKYMAYIIYIHISIIMTKYIVIWYMYWYNLIRYIRYVISYNLWHVSVRVKSESLLCFLSCKLPCWAKATKLRSPNHRDHSCQVLTAVPQHHMYPLVKSREVVSVLRDPPNWWLFEMGRRFSMNENGWFVLCWPVRIMGIDLSRVHKLSSFMAYLKIAIVPLEAEV